VLRDTLLAANPPYSLRHWQYLAVPVVAAAVTFFWHPQVARLGKLVLVLDDAGLGLFTVTATQKSLDAGLGWAAACVVGVITGIGGGVIRDVLLRQIPVVLRREIYAVAAAIGAVLVCVGRAVHQLHAVVDRYRPCRIRGTSDRAATALVGTDCAQSRGPGRRLTSALGRARLR
jgi:uncharacterized membrane protein YeiH